MTGIGRIVRAAALALAVGGAAGLSGCKPTAPSDDLVGEAKTDSVHAQCVRSGGDFLPTDGGGFLCARVPSDANQGCTSARDCESACLARSHTCAPVLPLMGCNEVLTDSGMQVTQCIE